MHITIDTSQPLSDRDRRVLAALIGDDTGPLVMPRSMFRDADTGILHPDGYTPPGPPVPPLPVPAPAAFAAKLGEAVAQFSPRGPATEARLPFAQQAGVRTSSTMPDDDDMPRTVAGERVFGVDVDAEMATVVSGAVRDGVVHITDHVRIPRELVEGEAATAGDFESAVMHGLTYPDLPDDADTHAHPEVPHPKSPVIEQPPVRHTNP